ncbi:hypothetical protein VTJ04DRAFT_8154 [Mycothermus thermophilus]|uniref:uncharacterized protein n=1 Tax=Humicola insolens TaxID=85995 RepID=UPI0037433A37
MAMRPSPLYLSFASVRIPAPHHPWTSMPVIAFGNLSSTTTVQTLLHGAVGPGCSPLISSCWKEKKTSIAVIGVDYGPMCGAHFALEVIIKRPPHHPKPPARPGLFYTHESFQTV